MALSDIPNCPSLFRCRGVGAEIADAVTQTMRGWADLEVAHWQRLQPNRTTTENTLRGLAASRPPLFLYEFSGGDVRLVSDVQQPAGPAAFARRPPHYLQLFKDALPHLPRDFSALICVSLSDFLADNVDAPVFCFQRRMDQTYPLLPDIDFIGKRYHQSPDLRDPVAYADKAVRAVFAGATTGGPVPKRVALNCTLPRLRAARFFQDNAKVDFRLPKVGKHLPAESRAILEAYSFCQKPVLSWQEQFRSRFIISMDGNGATCQRVAVALASNSVLMKYASPHLLYYFHGLEPWRHYLPIEQDEEVEKLVDAEAAQPGKFAGVAAAGQLFANNYLTQPRIVEYTALLLQAYAAALAG
jgi:hypothetical protein